MDSPSCVQGPRKGKPQLATPTRLTVAGPSRGGLPASIIPRDTPTEELRQIFRQLEVSLQYTGSRKGLRQLYRAMQRIETELELRKHIPELAP